MTVKQIEEKVIELKRLEPFVPFVIELVNGQSVQVPHAGLAINETGVGFLGPDGDIVDVEFTNVRAIRLLNSEAAV
jgi:hypothetical protein